MTITAAAPGAMRMLRVLAAILFVGKVIDTGAVIHSRSVQPSARVQGDGTPARECDAG
jgi:hypothetical protein